jgi:hypothetical protein
MEIRSFRRSDELHREVIPPFVNAVMSGAWRYVVSAVATSYIVK